jgi:biopolymer transport protein ExbD
MAFSFSDSGGGRRGRRFASSYLSAEINIVPLVDVVLVLLIIFMITANVMEFGLDIQVPKVRNVKNTAKELPVVNIVKNGETYLNEKPVNIHLLADRIRERYHNASAVYVRADSQTPWDPIAQVVSELGEAKFEIQMVTQPLDTTPRGHR